MHHTTSSKELLIELAKADQRVWTGSCPCQPFSVAGKGSDKRHLWGASFPVSDGVKAWPLIKAVKESGKGWKRGSHTMYVGFYPIDRIEADGTIKAEGHTVSFSEAEYIAKHLNLI